MHNETDVRAGVGRATLWFAYDHLGSLIVLNLIWLGLCLPLVTAPAASAALLREVDALANGHPVRGRRFLASACDLAGPATFLGAALVLASAVLAVDLSWYSSQVSSLGWGAAAGWAAAFWLALAGLALAAETAVELARKTQNLPRAMISAGREFTSRPWARARALTTAAGAAATLILSGIGALLLGGAIPAATLMLGRRHANREPIYLPGGSSTRTLRELLRPWE